MKLSVLMSVYSKESPLFLGECLESLKTQTLPAEEIVLVEDGPIGKELRATIAAYRKALPIRTLSLPSQSGLGAALRAGLEICRGQYVARMDSDDICVPERFQIQADFLETHPEVDVIGGAIAEFDCDWRSPNVIRQLPTSGSLLVRFAKHRNPLNHMTVMFRKESVITAGGYQHFQGFEDYYLWARMLLAGCQLENMTETLVYARCGNGMHSRRGGAEYCVQEIKLQLRLREMGFLKHYECLRNILVRGPVRLVPNQVRSMLYQRFLRKGIDTVPA
jgi:O104-antigen biosynthesis beta-1,3-galactosyltransferase